MKKNIILQLLALAASLFNPATTLLASTKESISMKKWFDQSACEKLIITQFQSFSIKKIIKEVTIGDKLYINSLMSEINKLPTSGDEMIKMGHDAEYLTLQFECEEKNETIKFYNSKIKTPDTSFFSKEARADDIWQEIMAHINPIKLGNFVPKLLDVEFSFKEFRVQYKGWEDRTHPGLTASLYVETYLITDTHTQKIQTVEVASGQLPPQDVAFTVGKTTYLLKTFSGFTSKTVDARNIIIIKK